ncbi:GDSL-type esterase/lipase family protein [Shimia aestuarii]|uniref:GDSL-type esterase/lipase family protein n=1 Tax=Shimia aestuarii TaxID=254406 RepID=UPI001FB401B5|nr:GDSL-type esterase/lipase family protein [Shimia aestuarii]
MKTVFCFGDSLTWGSCPQTGGRHGHADRWPVALGETLVGVEIIAEGLRGRSTVYDRPTAPADMNGGRILPVLLHSHAPVDLVVIMLGINDLCEGWDVSHVRDGLMRLVEIVRHHPWRLPETDVPDILLVSPPPMTPCWDADVTAQKVSRSEALAAAIAPLAEAMDVGFFDAASVARASTADGYHLEAADSRALGLALRNVVAGRLGLS